MLQIVIKATDEEIGDFDINLIDTEIGYLDGTTCTAQNIKNVVADYIHATDGLTDSKRFN